jgi:ABC-type antimicrobial peptide transport system permease subunit
MALGFMGSLVAARLLASQLFGTTPTDPAAYGGTALVLALSGLLAAALPAWRASRADPAAALRSE